jgi:hypothetical protein
MAKVSPPEAAPTMIIPQGTDIQVDVHGQLSIRTPGNLVIQSSGHYATLESMNGSIRIEPHARVEAVNVRCAKTCYIEGSLTAWKVVAEAIQLEDAAKANIVLQEAGRLEIGSEARMVGNFRSENELFLLFSRFADQLRAMPFFADRPAPAELPGRQEVIVESEVEVAVEEAEVARVREAPVIAAQEPGAKGELPDPLFFSLVILEREYGRPTYGPTSQRVIEELIKLLREPDLDTLRLTYRTLFGRIAEPGKDVQRVLGLIHGYFQAHR